jgi:hypothetical protein
MYGLQNMSLLVDNLVRCCGISKYLYNRILFRISDWNRISKKDKGVVIQFWDFSWNLDLFPYGKWCGLGAGTVDYDWRSVHVGPTMARTRVEFKCVAAVMHGSSPWMLGEEEGLSRDLINCSSGRRSNRCDWAARSGGDDDLSSDKSEFLCMRNPK